jgi:protein associated with RNAse G/E
VNYRRGSGKLFGKIVEKNLDKEEYEASWREMFKYPESIEESINLMDI